MDLKYLSKHTCTLLNKIIQDMDCAGVMANAAYVRQTRNNHSLGTFLPNTQDNRNIKTISWNLQKYFLQTDYISSSILDYN